MGGRWHMRVGRFFRAQSAVRQLRLHTQICRRVGIWPRRSKCSFRSELKFAMGEWVTGAAINMVGSVGINFGTNLLKLAHNQRERLAIVEAAAGENVVPQLPIMYFQVWWLGLLVFALGNILNFISFGYAAQSLLAALGSIQFLSNVGFAYFVLSEKVTARKIVATLFIVAGNIFLVSFGNHQSKVYTQKELLANYSSHVYLLYCAGLIILVMVNHVAYKQGRILMSSYTEQTFGAYWKTLLPFSYAMVSGIIGSHSVLFAKSLSILLRQTMNGGNELDGWFTYVILFMFICTASFWMTRLNDGLALFDAILIVPMFQIVWTFFSIFTGFVYFAEYQVLGSFRIVVLALGILILFLGILMLAPDLSEGPKAGHWVDSEELSPFVNVSERSHSQMAEEKNSRSWKSVVQCTYQEAGAVVSKAKVACRIFLGLAEDRIPVTSVFAMPMIASSRMAWRNAVVKDGLMSSISLEGDEV